MASFLSFLPGFYAAKQERHRGRKGAGASPFHTVNFFNDCRFFSGLDPVYSSFSHWTSTITPPLISTYSLLRM